MLKVCHFRCYVSVNQNHKDKSYGIIDVVVFLIKRTPDENYLHDSGRKNGRGNVLPEFNMTSHLVTLNNFLPHFLTLSCNL